MSDSFSQFKDILKARNYSLTKPRYVVFKVLQNKQPLTMTELLEACQDSLDRATLYRTIAAFEDAGIVHRLQIGWKYRLELSDIFTQHHHHMTCSNCGQTVDLPANPQLEQQLHDWALAQQFAMRRHQLEIQGLCRRCQASSSIL